MAVRIREPHLWMDALEKVRIAKTLQFVSGRLLDVGCGFNNLVRLHGSGLGVDIHAWPGVDVLVGDSARLPFPSSSFDTVAIVAAMNHIPNRLEVLCEVRRVLAANGRLVLTMIGPWTGRIAHLLFAKDEKTRDGLADGETMGMTNHEVDCLLQAAGFEVQKAIPFELRLNRVYVAAKAGR